MTEQKPLGSGFGPHTTAEEALAGRNLQGKIAIVTGGHSGLGLETTRVCRKPAPPLSPVLATSKKANVNIADEERGSHSTGLGESGLH